MLNFTKSILKRVSFNATLFSKELNKAYSVLLPYELKELKIWLLDFVKEKPELKHCVLKIKE